jgi:hypothetical protein
MIVNHEVRLPSTTTRTLVTQLAVHRLLDPREEGVVVEAGVSVENVSAGAQAYV